MQRKLEATFESPGTVRSTIDTPYACTAQHGTTIDFLIGSYFKSLSDGDVPPVKGRFEDVSSVDEGAATKGILQVLHTQVNTDTSTHQSLVPYSLIL